MTNETERVFTKDEEVRIHALNLAVSTYREVFRISRDGEEQPALADQVLDDAAKYAGFIRGHRRHSADRAALIAELTRLLNQYPELPIPTIDDSHLDQAGEVTNR